MSSEEGQQLMMSEEGQISSSKDSKIPKEYERIWNLKQNGQASFCLYTGYDSIAADLGTVLRDAIDAGSSKEITEEALSKVDKVFFESMDGDKGDSSFGNATEDFTEKQTVQLGRETLLAGGYGDFVLTTTDGEKNRVVNKSGYTGKLYAGGIVDGTIRSICGFIYNTAVTVPMTGAEVKELINDGKPMKDEATGNTAVFEYGWAGIDVSLDDNGKVSSIKWDDKELSDTETYQVVFTSGDYTDEFAAAHEITDSEDQIYDIFVSYLSKNSAVSAPEATR